jgi:hypothetical protein
MRRWKCKSDNSFQSYDASGKTITMRGRVRTKPTRRSVGAVLSTGIDWNHKAKPVTNTWTSRVDGRVSYAAISVRAEPRINASGHFWGWCTKSDRCTKSALGGRPILRPSKHHTICCCHLAAGFRISKDCLVAAALVLLDYHFFTIPGLFATAH